MKYNVVYVSLLACSFVAAHAADMPTGERRGIRHVPMGVPIRGMHHKRSMSRQYRRPYVQVCNKKGKHCRIVVENEKQIQLSLGRELKKKELQELRNQLQLETDPQKQLALKALIDKKREEIRELKHAWKEEYYKTIDENSTATEAQKQLRKTIREKKERRYARKHHGKQMVDPEKQAQLQAELAIMKQELNALRLQLKQLKEVESKTALPAEVALPVPSAPPAPQEISVAQPAASQMMPMGQIPVAQLG